MPPRKSKTLRQSVSHTDVTGDAAQTNGAQQPEPRTKTVWSQIDSNSFDGFKVQYKQHFRQYEQVKDGSKKRKLPPDLDLSEKKNPALQPNPFEDTMLPDTMYEVRQQDMWEDTSRYRKFTSK